MIAKLKNKILVLLTLFTPRSNSLFQATFEQAAVGIAHVSPNGNWLRVNEKVCRIVGYSREELMQLTFQDITHPDDLGPDMALLGEMLSEKIPTYTLEKRYFHKLGHMVWVRLTVSLSWKHKGVPDFFISVIEDITHLKNIEAENNRLKANAADLVEQQVIAQSMLALAHELNQPLNASGSYSEAALRLAKEEPLNREKLNLVLKLNIAQIQRAGDVLRDLMKGMQHNAHADQRLDLAQFIKEFILHFRSLQHKDIQDVEFQAFEPDVYVIAKPLLLEKALRNLLVNACQAIEPINNEGEKLKIWLKLAQKNDVVTVSITNTGALIKPDVAEKMFSPFFTTKKTGGGMGLSISRNLIESCNGKLWYEPVDGKTTFHFSLSNASSTSKLN